ncbi:TPA: hypothetical protein N0F65_003905 [Lagenidium giganteum]|uniref:Uncharacterized protein n=1 Tax=Lagenidium giganteum TaxID=4803 RepID=A0AAV2ZFD6_9STRA|nr:TPA: hypothetical protein N0F65_003905 [Lagenidium giganteum]
MEHTVPHTAMVLSLVRVSERVSGLMQARPSAEATVKYTGGLVAALVALRYAKSLRSACVIGLVSGVIAHSVYADVLKRQWRLTTASKKLTQLPAAAAPMASTEAAGPVHRPTALLT